MSLSVLFLVLLFTVSIVGIVIVVAAVFDMFITHNTFLYNISIYFIYSVHVVLCMLLSIAILT